MTKPEPDSREARLAEQLRRNLRRRKAPETPDASVAEGREGEGQQAEGTPPGKDR